MAPGWGAQRAGQPMPERGLWFRRTLATLVGIVLTAWLGWLVVRPLLHPRTHLVLLSGDVGSAAMALDAVPADFVVEDFRELLALNPVLHGGMGEEQRTLILGSLQNPDEMQHLADRLNERITGSNDVLILYVAAHGLTQDGDAWLVASGADPASALGGRYRLGSLLAQLRECRAKTKVLLLDAGRLEYDPLRGLLENDFPTRLVEQVEQLGDPQLWVLVSHATGQRSHLSAALGRSVFGYFVAAGLKGAADANRDRTVDLGEFSRFMTAGVAGWVQQTTGNMAQQTPLLVSGSGNVAPSHWPALIAVPRRSKAEPPVLDHGRSIKQARAELAVEGQAADKGRRELNSLVASGLARSTPRGRLGHMIGDAVQRTVSSTINRAKLPGAAKAAAPMVETATTDEKAKADDPVAKANAANDKAAPADKGASSSDSGEKQGNGGKAKQKSESDTSKNDKASDSKSTTDSASEQTNLSQLAYELQRAWQLRDALAAFDAPKARAVDFAPDLWRELELSLLRIDRQLRTGFVAKASGVHAELRLIVDALEALHLYRSIEHLPLSSLASRLAALQPGLSLTGLAPSSLALAQLIARERGTPIPAELLPLIARYDQLVASGNRSDLEKLAADLTSEHDRWRELRMVRQLALRPELDWRLVKLLLEAVNAGELAAASDLTATAWISAEVKRGDALRLPAERQLLASATVNRETLISQLSEARDTYRAALAKMAEVSKAQRLANDVFHRLPDYLAWNAKAGGDASAGPTDSQLRSLLTALEALAGTLESREPAKLIAIRDKTSQLIATQAEVELVASGLAIEQVLAESPPPVAAWRIELLLELPFLSADIRQVLSASMANIDATLASEVRTAEQPSPSESPTIASIADSPNLARRAALVGRMCEISFPDTTNSQLRAFVQVSDSLGSGSASEFAALSPRERRDLLADRLQDLVRNLPAEIIRGVESNADVSSPSNRAARLARLHSLGRALRTVDPRQDISNAEIDWATSLTSAAAYDLLVWHSQRAILAAEDAPPQEGAYLARVAQDYRRLATAIPKQPPLDGGSQLPMALTGPERVALTYRTQQVVDFKLTNTSASRQKFWVAMDTNEQLVQATSSDLRTFYSWPELNAVAAAGDQAATIGQRVARLPATLELAAGQSTQLPLRLVRRSPSPHASHLVIRVLTAESTARHDVTIDLPPPEDLQLTIAGPVGRWTPLPAGVELLPFPNRVNSFALQLASGKPVRRTVDVELYPLLSLPPQGIPSVPLSTADAARLKSEMSIGSPVAEARAVVLPASGEPVMLTLKAPEAALPPANVTAKTTADSANGKAAPKMPASDKPPPVPLVKGLVVAITDQADKRQTFRQLSIAPQRPQRYVRPQVRYRAGRERIEIRVSAQDQALLPADGVRIRGEIAEPLPVDAERQLDGVLHRGKDEAELYVEIPQSPGQFVTLRLTIDDYPRAIYYRVPIGGETSDIPEELDLLAVRIAGLPAGTIYKPPTASILVHLAVDAPASISKVPPLRIEVGVDQNRDRELRGDETVVVSADRQVTAALVGVGKAGDLQIEAKVSDLAIDVPAAAFAGGRANVLAHAVLGDSEAWSEPIEIVIDAQPPRVAGLELRPAATVVIGKDVLVSALADDAGLSGVAKLEAAFDLDRSGKFGPASKPVAGALRDDGRWTVSVPTAGVGAGTYNLLVRATDKAGNEGQPARASIRLIPPEEAEADAKKSNSADITGVVMYGDEPQAAVTVNLNRDTGAPPAPKSKGKKAKTPPPPPPLAQATTDAAGKFTFPKVAPGKYMVSAEGLVRNKIRTADAAVAFAKPQEVQPVTLKLK